MIASSVDQQPRQARAGQRFRSRLQEAGWGGKSMSRGGQEHGLPQRPLLRQAIWHSWLEKVNPSKGIAAECRRYAAGFSFAHRGLSMTTSQIPASSAGGWPAGWLHESGRGLPQSKEGFARGCSVTPKIAGRRSLPAQAFRSGTSSSNSPSPLRLRIRKRAAPRASRPAAVGSHWQDSV